MIQGKNIVIWVRIIVPTPLYTPQIESMPVLAIVLLGMETSMKYLCSNEVTSCSFGCLFGPFVLAEMSQDGTMMTGGRYHHHNAKNL